MGFLVLESSNNNLSWIIGKRPESGMIARSLRSGILWGWYYNPQTYVMRFIDHTDEVSFKATKHEQYNYIGSLQYCSPLLLSTIITELFSTGMNKENDLDIKSESKLTINLIRLNSRGLNFISKLNAHIKKFNISAIQTKYHNLYKLEIISPNNTIRELLNYSYMLGNLLNVLVIGYVDKPRIEQLEKMLNFAIEIGVGYYPRYLIKTTMISHDEFKVLKNKLETIGDNKVSMFWGNSQIQRYNFVESHISFNSDIIDFGCGEGFYVKKILPQLSKLNKYVAWDLDPEELIKVKYFKEKNPEFDNLIIPESDKELFEIVNKLTSKPTILLSEVFEHIEKTKAIELLEKIKSSVKFGSIIITTPDVGFNIHYSADGEINSRHPDHKHEYTQEEFLSIINNIFDDTYSKNFYQVGDIIDSNSITQSFIITQV